MAYVPKDARWYLATLIEEITVEGEALSVVHKNLTLVRADSPEQAYERAVLLGAQSEGSYENPQGNRVEIKFRGLNNLSVIHEELEHGAELYYDESIGLAEDKIRALIRRKEELSVFQPITPTRGPDYSSREVLEEATRLIKKQD